MLVVSGSITMPRAIAPRLDFSETDLRQLARRTKDASQARRLLALAAIYGGGPRTEVNSPGFAGGVNS